MQTLTDCNYSQTVWRTPLRHVSLGLDPASCQGFVFHFYSYIKVSAKCRCYFLAANIKMFVEEFLIFLIQIYNILTGL